MTAVELRPMQAAELPLLLDWLRAPHVREWWRDEPDDLAAVQAKYGPCLDGDDPTELFVIVAGGCPVGMIQRYLLADEPEWTKVFAGVMDVSDAAGIDYLIGKPEAVGRGAGTAAVTAFAAMVFEWRPVASIIVSVQQANPASWRVLEKSGFRRIWSGELDSPDPSDVGPEYVYLLQRSE